MKRKTATIITRSVVFTAIVVSTIIVFFSLSYQGYFDDATQASHNISKAAYNLEIKRRIVFYNGINSDYILVIEGLCSIKDQKNQMEVTCKKGKVLIKNTF